MEPEFPTQTNHVPPVEEVAQPVANSDPASVPESLASYSAPEEGHQLRWIFLGEQGLRAGWSVLIFLALFMLFMFGSFVFPILVLTLSSLSLQETCAILFAVTCRTYL